MPHPNSKKLRDQLVLEEGMKLQAYDDKTGLPVKPGEKCKGKLTVGVGRNLDDNPLTPQEKLVVGHDARTQPITEAQAMFLLQNDLSEVFAELDRVLPWWIQLDEVRARVLADLNFNMGWTKLSKFKNFLFQLRAEHYPKAAEELKNSLWYNQVKTRGVRLVEMMKTGEDYTA